MSTLAPNQILEFVRHKDYEFVRYLSHGGFGATVLLRDPEIDEPLVCKKYQPLDDAHREEFFANFIREIKLLHNVFHVNVVRIFGSYLYPKTHSGFILMEFIDGDDVASYIGNYGPFDDVFVQAIAGFVHLESKGVLHRDIRESNLMVTAEGVVKIIDFGFGKKIDTETDFQKSISLNWQYPLPKEFSKHVYDFCTEVYFVGQLFSKILSDVGTTTKFQAVLEQMCSQDPDRRQKSFAEVQKQLRTSGQAKGLFTEDEREKFSRFADELVNAVSQVEPGVKYVLEVSKIISRLNEIYTKSMLSSSINNPIELLRVFLDGNYRYWSSRSFEVEVLEGFLEMLTDSAPHKQQIILANLHTRFDSIKRSAPPPTVDEVEDDIPF